MWYFLVMVLAKTQNTRICENGMMTAANRREMVFRSRWTWRRSKEGTLVFDVPYVFGKANPFQSPRSLNAMSSVKAHRFVLVGQDGIFYSERARKRASGRSLCQVSSQVRWTSNWCLVWSHLRKCNPPTTFDESLASPHVSPKIGSDWKPPQTSLL